MSSPTPEFSITKSPYCGGPPVSSIGPAEKEMEIGEGFLTGTVGSADAGRCLSAVAWVSATAETRRWLSVTLGEGGGEVSEVQHLQHLENRAVVQLQQLTSNHMTRNFSSQ